MKQQIKFQKFLLSKKRNITYCCENQISNSCVIQLEKNFFHTTKM